MPPAAAPPILFNRWSYAGWLTAIITALPENSIVGIFYIVGASLWTLEAVLSIWVVQLVRRSPSPNPEPCGTLNPVVLRLAAPPESCSWCAAARSQSLNPVAP